MQKIDLYRGFFGIGIYQPDHKENIGTLWRHAYLYNASFIFTIGKKYHKQCSDTSDAYNHIPFYYYEIYEEFKNNLPEGCAKNIFAIELTENAYDLSTFSHPNRCAYLLGSESNGLPSHIINDIKCIKIYSPKSASMNVATAGTLIMYDRVIKQKIMSILKEIDYGK